MRTKLDLRTIKMTYPVSFFGRGGKGGLAVRISKVAKIALKELGYIDPVRKQHVIGVSQVLQAIKAGDLQKVFGSIKSQIKNEEMARSGMDVNLYERIYLEHLSKIRDIYAGLAPISKDILENAVWMHDVGVPLGDSMTHPKIGADLIFTLFGRGTYSRKVADLVGEHASFSHLTCETFPRDLYGMSKRSLDMLCLLDFCDSSARTNSNGDVYNPIGLKGIALYSKYAVTRSLTEYENPEQMFKLRLKYGFAPACFNKEIDQKVTNVVLRKMGSEKNKFISFYGSRFRSVFLDVLISSLDSDKDKGKLLADIYELTQKNRMCGDVALTVPADFDLGYVLAKDMDGFKKKFGQYYSDNGINKTLKADTMTNSLVLNVKAIGY